MEGLVVMSTVGSLSLSNPASAWHLGVHAVHPGVSSCFCCACRLFANEAGAAGSKSWAPGGHLPEHTQVSLSLPLGPGEQMHLRINAVGDNLGVEMGRVN